MKTGSGRNGQRSPHPRSRRGSARGPYDALKRGIDVLGAGAGLILLAPLFLAIGIAIRLDSHGSIFFRQERAGLDGRLFRLWKFRTMVPGAVNMGAGYDVVPDDPRITRVGKLLREVSLDELPQLINVLMGEMSLVGPRPALPFQAEEYSDREWGRLVLRPGMTGLAQVEGRNNLTWPEKIELDLSYIEKRSLMVDLSLLLRTVRRVALREGIFERQA